MSTPTPAEIKARYPALASLSDPTVQIAIDDAVPMFDVDRWGDLYAQGFAAYVAHILTVDKSLANGGAGTTGIVQSKSVGDASMSYQQMSARPGQSSFATTAYGQRYLYLQRLAGMGAIAV